MRIALLAPLPPEKNGIADYANHFRAALEQNGVQVLTPLAGCPATNDALRAHIDAFDWNGVDLVHAELGGGRLIEFQALQQLRQRFPHLPLTATVHDPERLVWRSAQMPWPLAWMQRLPSPFPQVATLLCSPLTLREERRLAAGLTRLFTLTRIGGECLARCMHLTPQQLAVIAHGNLDIPAVPPPPIDPIRLLYFGFIYRGKGIEDLLNALAKVFARQPALRKSLSLTLAGGTTAEMTFGNHNNYLQQLQELIVELKLESSIQWHLDLPAEEIPTLIQAHHALVLPYRESKKLSLLGVQRGTSGALSWAAACGRGAITSDARAFAEEVAGGNGMIFPQGDVDALADRLEELAHQPELAMRWAARAAEIGRARRWTETARHFKHVFIEACARKTV